MRNYTRMVRRRCTGTHADHMRPRRNLTVLPTIRAAYFRQQYTVAAGSILNPTVSTRTARSLEFYVCVQVHICVNQRFFIGPAEPKDLSVVDGDLKVDFTVRSLAGKLRFCVQVAVVDRPLTERGCDE